MESLVANKIDHLQIFEKIICKMIEIVSSDCDDKKTCCIIVNIYYVDFTNKGHNNSSYDYNYVTT